MMKTRNSDNPITSRKRPVPERTCVACRSTRPKRELVRIVRTSDGSVALDATGKAPGRGAYLCTSLACWEKATKGSILEHAFRSTIKQENRNALLMSGKKLLEEKAIGQNE